MPRKTRAEIINKIKELDENADVEVLGKLPSHRLMCILEDLEKPEEQIEIEDFSSRMGSKN